MAELLQNWLNNEVGLSTNIANFERDFANGYLFGEILAKFRQQDDFSSFENKNTYEAKIANFKRLEPTLKALGIKFNATHSNAMMGGERGASLRLLYQLKMATERLLLSCAAGNQGKGGSKHQQPSSSVVVTKGIRIPRDRYDGHERRFFEHRLRATCPNVKQARSQRVTGRFNEERQKQEMVAAEMGTIDARRMDEQREIHRISLRERLRQNQNAHDEWTVHCLQIWENNMQIRAEGEKRQVDYETRTQLAQQTRNERTRAEAQSEVYDGIRVFEESLDEQASSVRDVAEGSFPQMPSAAEDGKQASLYFLRIKESKQASSVARKERERRRRRFLVEQEHEQDLLEESKLEELMFEKLGRESEEEKRINYAVWRTQQYADVITQGRELRQQGYKVRRKADQQEATQRDKDLMAEKMETLRQRMERERVRYRAIGNTKRAKHRAHLSENSEDILGQIVDIAFASMQQQQLTDNVDVDETLWREWTQLFQKNIPVVASQPLALCEEEKYPLSAAPPVGDVEADSPDAALWEEAIKDYIHCRGQWEFKPIISEAGAGSVKAPSPVPDDIPDRGKRRDSGARGLKAPSPVPDDPSDRGGRRDSKTRGLKAPSPVPDDHSDRGGRRDSVAGSIVLPPNAAAECAKILDGPAAALSFVDRLEREPDIVEGHPVNYRLGYVVAALLDRFHAQPPAPDPPPMPDVPVRLVVTGKPFSGQRTVATRLAGTFNLHVIDVDEVVRECLHLSKRPDLGAASAIEVLSFHAEASDERCQWHEENGNPYIREMQTIGLEMQERMGKGLALDAELYVRLITTKIRSLFPDSVTKSEPHAPASGHGEDNAPRPDFDVAVDAADGAAVSQSLGPDLTLPHPGLAGALGASPRPASRDGDSTHGEAVAVLADATTRGFAAGVDDRVGAHRGAGAGPAAPDPAREYAVGEPLGWILVGFPDDAERLGLFERFLSGWVYPNARPPTEAEIKKLEAALLAPRPPEEPPPFELTQGGYDLHIRLDVSTDEAVRRAMGRCVDPVTSLSYHLEDHPPCSKNQVIYERLRPVDDLTNSMGSLTFRIHSFDSAQPKLDTLLAHFGPYADMKRLVSVDASGTTDSVYEAVAEQVTELLNRKTPSRLGGDVLEDDAAPLSADGLSDDADPDPLVDGDSNPTRGTATPDAPESLDVPPADVPASPAPDESPRPDESPPKDPPPDEVVPAELCVDKFEEQVFQMLLGEWKELQGNFTNSLQQLYMWHRTHLADVRSGVYGIKQRFLKYLQRQDDKQALVDSFVYRLNCHTEEDPDIGEQDSRKEELHQQVDDLQEQLLAKVNQQKADDLCHLGDIRKSFWVEMQAEVVAAQVQHAVQLEAKRYHAACQLLAHFYYSAMDMAPPEPPPAPPSIDAMGTLDVAKEEVSEPKKKPAKDKKKQEEVKAEPEGPEARAARIARRAGDRWEFPFLDVLMSQAQQAVWPLLEYTPPPTSPPPDAPEPKAKAKAKAKGRASPGPGDVDAEPPKPAPAMYVDLQQALLAERVSFAHRLSVTRNWAERRLVHLNEAAARTFVELEDWASIRRDQGVEAVSGLIDALKEHVEDECQIPARLTFEEAPLQRPPSVPSKAPKPDPTPPQAEAEIPYRFSIGQLDEILEMTACLANGSGTDSRVLPVPSLMSMLTRLTQAEVQGAVPKCWRFCDVERLQRLCGLFDHPPGVGSVDCVEFLVHIGLMHSPLGWPSLETLEEVRAHIERQAPPPPGARWPDYWVPDSAILSSPLFADTGAEAALAAKFGAKLAVAPGRYDRSQAQLAWVCRVLQAFPAPLRQEQSWQLEAAWYDFDEARFEEERARSAELLDDVKSTPSVAPPTDSMGAGPDAPPAAESVASEPATPRPPRPEAPQTPSKPAAFYVSIRQLMSYLCQGATPEEGFARTLAVLGPPGDGHDQPGSVPMPELHAALLQFGARPMPLPFDDGSPRLPSLGQMCEELGQEPDAGFSVAEFLALPEAPGLLERVGFHRRHSRVEVERLFPKGLKPGTRLRPDGR